MQEQEQLVEDSIGATEAEAPQEGLADETTEASGLDEPVYYEIEDIKATAQELKEWQKAFEGKKSQDADYTRKSQANAEKARQIEAERERASETLTLLTELEGEIASLAMGDLDKIDMDMLRDSDPSEYLRVKEMREERSQWRNKLNQKLVEVQRKAAEDSYKTLVKLNGWDDPETGPAKYEKDSKAIASYVQEVGMDQRAFAKILDPHVMTALLEAARYREIKKSNPTVKNRVVQAPKTSKPSITTQKKPLSLAERMYGKKS